MKAKNIYYENTQLFNLHFRVTLDITKKDQNKWCNGKNIQTIKFTNIMVIICLKKIYFQNQELNIYQKLGKLLNVFKFWRFRFVWLEMWLFQWFSVIFINEQFNVFWRDQNSVSNNQITFDRTRSICASFIVTFDQFITLVI